MKRKNTGIELLRTVSMMFVVTLHVLNGGGILDTASRNSYQGKLAYTIFIIAFCGVDCFALISGYVGINSQVRLSRIIQLWLTVFFYSVIITAAFAIFGPDSVTPEIWLNAIFPITSNEYWYMTAYMGMLILTPAINYGIKVLTKRTYTIIVISIFLFVSFVPWVLHMHPYSLNAGYSTIWLCYLYMVGGYIKRFDVDKKINGISAILIYSISAFATFMAYRRQVDGLIEYTSPTIFVCAVALLVFCSKMNIDGSSKSSRFICLISPSALSVFLIHVHPLVYSMLIGGRFALYVEYSVLGFVFAVIATVLVIYCICLITDIPRRMLFKYINLSERMRNVDIWLSSDENN